MRNPHHARRELGWWEGAYKCQPPMYVVARCTATLRLRRVFGVTEPLRKEVAGLGRYSALQNGKRGYLVISRFGRQGVRSWDRLHVPSYLRADIIHTWCDIPSGIYTAMESRLLRCARNSAKCSRPSCSYLLDNLFLSWIKQIDIERSTSHRRKNTIPRDWGAFNRETRVQVS
jgi:hypothetical protein